MATSDEIIACIIILLDYGAITTVLMTMSLFDGLCEFSVPLSVSPQLSKEEAETAEHLHRSSWRIPTVLTASVAVVGNAPAVYYSYQEFGSLDMGALIGASLVLGVVMVVAACLAVVIGLRRWRSRSKGGVDGEEARNANDV